MKAILTVISALLLLNSPHAFAMEFSGKIALESGFFVESTRNKGLEESRISFSLEPELFHSWNNNKDSLTIMPLLRYDRNNPDRRYMDIKEFKWIHRSDSWELELGITKIFWGVVETRHLVDVINQVDMQEFPDIDVRLGQPMIHVSKLLGSGALDVFVLPYFRTRSYPNNVSRFSLPVFVDSDNALYESDKKNKHLDYALRWSDAIDDIDYAVSFFNGTDRQASLVQKENQLFPYYGQIKQWSVEAQLTNEACLYKLEAIKKYTSQQDYSAATLGFEYSFYSINDSRADVGYILEYNWDERGEKSTNYLQNDIFMASRIVLNNYSDTEIIAGTTYDFDNDGWTGKISLKHRINNNFQFEARYWWFDSKNATDDYSDPLNYYTNNDLLQFYISYFF